MGVARRLHSQHRRHEFVSLRFERGPVRRGFLAGRRPLGTSVVLPGSEEQENHGADRARQRVEKCIAHVHRDTASGLPVPATPREGARSSSVDLGSVRSRSAGGLTAASCGARRRPQGRRGARLQQWGARRRRTYRRRPPAVAQQYEYRNRSRWTPKYGRADAVRPRRDRTLRHPWASPATRRK